MHGTRVSTCLLHITMLLLTVWSVEQQPLSYICKIAYYNEPRCACSEVSQTLHVNCSPNVTRFFSMHLNDTFEENIIPDVLDTVLTDKMTNVRFSMLMNIHNWHNMNRPRVLSVLNILSSVAYKPCA